MIDKWINAVKTWWSPSFDVNNERFVGHEISAVTIRKTSILLGLYDFPLGGEITITECEGKTDVKDEFMPTAYLMVGGVVEVFTDEGYLKIKNGGDEWNINECEG